MLQAALVHQYFDVEHIAAVSPMHRTDGSVDLALQIEFAVPSRVAALLLEHRGFFHIPCSKIGTLELIASRVRSWKSRTTKWRPQLEYLTAAVTEGCDTAIKVRMGVQEWHLIGILCGRLNISPGQWFVAASYNAEVGEEQLDKVLATLPLDNLG